MMCISAASDVIDRVSVELCVRFVILIQPKHDMFGDPRVVYAHEGFENFMAYLQLTVSVSQSLMHSAA